MTNERAELLEAAKALGAAFSNSALHKKYIELNQELNKNPEARKKYEEFKNAQAELEIARLNNGRVSFEAEYALSQMYTNIVLNPVVKEYMKVEFELTSLYSEALTLICETCEIRPPEILK